MRRGSNLRVLHIITGLDVGGAETALAKLCEGLGHHQIDSAVASLSSAGTMRDRLNQSSTPVMEVGIPRGRISLRGLRRLRFLVRDFGPDVVHGWMYHGNLAATMAVAARSPPVVWGIRQSLYQISDERPLTRAVIRASAVVSGTAAAIVYNSAVSEMQHATAGYRRARAVVIHNGFDLRRFRKNPQLRAKLRAELHVGPDVNIICCVARVHPVKNHAGLLQALAAVREIHAGVRLLLVGSGLDHQNSTLRSMILSHGVESLVHLAGESSDVAGWLSAADLFCLASDAEAFPNAVGEAMACELPCVATNVGDTARLIGDCGWVVPPRDGGALQGALDDALRMSPEQRADVGARARGRIAAYFSVEEITRQYVALYGRVAGTESVVASA